jgi:hypothetical protein
MLYIFRQYLLTPRKIPSTDTHGRCRTRVSLHADTRGWCILYTLYRPITNHRLEKLCCSFNEAWKYKLVHLGCNKYILKVWSTSTSIYLPCFTIVLNIIYICVCVIFVDIIICVLFVERGQSISCDNFLSNEDTEHGYSRKIPSTDTHGRCRTRVSLHADTRGWCILYPMLYIFRQYLLTPACDSCTVSSNCTNKSYLETVTVHGVFNNTHERFLVTVPMNDILWQYPWDTYGR